MIVVNVRGLPANSPEIVYIGRLCGKWKRSPLANPFRIGSADRATVLARYRDWLAQRIQAGHQPTIDALLAIPEGAQVGCWCAPLRCHAEIVIQFARKLRSARG